MQEAVAIGIVLHLLSFCSADRNRRDWPKTRNSRCTHRSCGSDFAIAVRSLLLKALSRFLPELCHSKPVLRAVFTAVQRRTREKFLYPYLGFLGFIFPL